MDIHKKIKELVKIRNTTISGLCQKIGMTESGFNFSMKNNTLKIETLQKIAEVLEMPVCCFFEDGETDISQSMQKNEIEILKKIRGQLEALLIIYMTYWDRHKNQEVKNG